MKNAMPAETAAEMRIPGSLGGALVDAAIYVIVIVSTLAAVFHLISARAMSGAPVIASVIWVFFVCMVVRSVCRNEGGIRRFIVNRIGKFAPRQVAEIAGPCNGPMELRFGYDLFHRRFHYLKVRCDGIKTIDWGPGQATSLAGCDMNDWQVAVWFDHDSVVKPTFSRYDLYSVGPARPRSGTEALGNQFIAFLRGAGVAVARTDPARLRHLAGSQGIVSHPLRPVGKVTLEPDVYAAHAEGGYIGEGEKVEVVDARGLSLIVRRVAAEPSRHNGRG